MKITLNYVQICLKVFLLKITKTFSQIIPNIRDVFQHIPHSSWSWVQPSLTASYVQGSVPRDLLALICVILKSGLWGTYGICRLWMRNLKEKRVQWLSQGSCSDRDPETVVPSACTHRMPLTHTQVMANTAQHIVWHVFTGVFAGKSEWGIPDPASQTQRSPGRCWNGLDHGSSPNQVMLTHHSLCPLQAHTHFCAEKEGISLLFFKTWNPYVHYVWLIRHSPINEHNSLL